MKDFALACAGVVLFVACAELGAQSVAPADVAPKARAALEQACKADAAAVEAGLHKPDPKVTEACEVVRAACK